MRSGLMQLLIEHNLHCFAQLSSEIHSQLVTEQYLKTKIRSPMGKIESKNRSYS
jgi:hypothetical protein